MINITRPTQTPASLATKNIQDYLDKLAIWQQNPTGEKPKSTASYRNSDLIIAFDTYFFSKCYLTERKFHTALLMEVEHFIPQNERPDLKYSWTNLYPADADANKMKPNKTPNGGYLDPCSPLDDVEKDITYRFDVDLEECQFESVNLSNKKAINTAQLLHRIHNGHDVNTKAKTAGLRKAIAMQRDKIYKTILAWQHAQKFKDAVEEANYRLELKTLLSKKAPFTMLMRSTSAVKIYVPKEFLD
jgi:hypothetical protein